MKIIRVECVCVDSNLSRMGEVGVRAAAGGGLRGLPLHRLPSLLPHYKSRVVIKRT